MIGMVVRAGFISVRVVTDRSGAVAGREYAVRLRWTGSKVEVIDVKDLSALVESVGNDFLQAAVARDTAKMKALSTPAAYAAFTRFSPEGSWSSPGRCTLERPDPAVCEVTIVSGVPAQGNWALIFRFEFGAATTGKVKITRATFGGDAG